MIGGTDVICSVRSDIPVADVIFRTIRRYWPQFVFQNATDAGPFTPQEGPWLPRPSGREFFIYRDEQAARSWDEHGETVENLNAMLHIILPEPGVAPALASVTLVCGDLTGEMGAIVESLQTCFGDLIESVRPWDAPFAGEAA